MNRHELLGLFAGAASLLGPIVTFGADGAEPDPGVATAAGAEEPDAAAHELGHVIQQRQAPAQPAGATRRPGERIMRPDYGAGDSTDPESTGRVKVKMPAASRPAETLSLNYRKVSRGSVRVRNLYSLQNRVHIRGADNSLYALASGTYEAQNGDQILIRAGDLSVRPSREVVVKGKKILQNYVPTQQADEKTWRPIVVLTSGLADGRYAGPAGAWLEVSNGEIIAAGGAMQAHQPPPFYDVGGDGSLTFRD